MSALVYGSVCSGIEAATVAWHPLGWRPSFFSEIEAAPRAVLQHRHPEVPLHGDFTTIREGQYGAIDLLVGGTPCQSFSVAGLRGGLADDRGNLALQFLSLARRLRPRWLVWENVPGVLSSNGGRDFGSILGGMVELGYGFAYRVLDAQYVRVDGFGRAVPQRRRRVFVVGHLGDWRRPAAVLLERACLRGDPAPRREAGEDAARCLTRGSGGGQRYDWETENFVAGCLNGLSEYGADVPTLRAKGGDAAGGSEALIAFDARQSDVCIYGNRSAPLDTCGFSQAIAFSCKDHGADATDEGATPTLRAMGFDRSHANAGGQLAIATITETKYGVSHADASQAGPDQALRALREAVGPQAFAEWGAGVVAALRAQEVLRSGLHGESVRCPPDNGHSMGDDAPSLAEAGSAGPVRALWQAGCLGCPPQGWQPSERLARELGAHLSLLPHQRASAARFLLGLWRASEGLGLLRQALSALQEVWRPTQDAGQPAQIDASPWAVRRLTPRECERLMGFTDDYTLVPWRGGLLPDGPRYKALGNSMAVNVMRWIGQRIEMVDAAAPHLAEVA